MQELTADAHWIGTCHPCDDNHMHFGVYLIEAPELNEATPLMGPFPGGLVPFGEGSWLVVGEVTVW